MPADPRRTSPRAVATTPARSRCSAATSRARPTADSPDRDPHRRRQRRRALKVTAGATLVRDSEPAHEVAETARQGRRHPLRVRPGRQAPPARRRDVADLTRDEDVVIALGSRNQRLASSGSPTRPARRRRPSLAGRTARDPRRRGRLREHAAPRALRDGHEARGRPPRGLTPEARSTARPRGRRTGARRPARADHPKIAAYRAAVEDAAGPPSSRSSRCASGHQVLCDRLGLDLAFKDIVFQGTQSRVEIDGREENVGFYNTFVARAGEPPARRRHGAGRPGRPATSTWSRDRTTAASSSTPSRSSPRTASPCSTACCSTCSATDPTGPRVSSPAVHLRPRHEEERPSSGSSGSHRRGGAVRADRGRRAVVRAQVDLGGAVLPSRTTVSVTSSPGRWPRIVATSELGARDRSRRRPW